MKLANKIESVFNILKNDKYTIPGISWQTYIHNNTIRKIVDCNIVEQTNNKFTLNFKFHPNCYYRLIEIDDKMYMITKNKKQLIVNKA